MAPCRYENQMLLVCLSRSAERRSLPSVRSADFEGDFRMARVGAKMDPTCAPTPITAECITMCYGGRRIVLQPVITGGTQNGFALGADEVPLGLRPARKRTEIGVQLIFSLHRRLASRTRRPCCDQLVECGPPRQPLSSHNNRRRREIVRASGSPPRQPTPFRSACRGEWVGWGA